MNKYKKIILILSVAIFCEAVIIAGIWMSSKPAKPRKQDLPASAKPAKDLGKIAIVIDDWGYNIDSLDLLKQIKYPLTLAILPNLNYSLRISKEAAGWNKQIILHLPMESQDKADLEQNTIMVSMDEQSVRNILNNDLNSIVYAKGVSSHMGSAATADAKTMTIIFEELKKRKLYFLDSFVCPVSVCGSIAHSVNIPFAKRDVFLDNREDFSYIKQQVNILKSHARKYGSVIGIGHNRKPTLEALAKIMPETAKEGYRFVYVSELVQ